MVREKRDAWYNGKIQLERERERESRNFGATAITITKLSFPYHVLSPNVTSAYQVVTFTESSDRATTTALCPNQTDKRRFFCSVDVTVITA